LRLQNLFLKLLLDIRYKFMLDKSGNQKAKGALEKDDEISKQVFNGVLDSQCKFSFDLR